MNAPRSAWARIRVVLVVIAAVFAIPIAVIAILFAGAERRR
ncbi:hypothetical protein [Sphingomonas oligophenolica]|nr:hypothetical protein [Sphingomonas oligophenolica]